MPQIKIKQLEGLSAGSILFLDSSTTVGEDNNNLYWDSSNNRLGLGVNTPSITLEVNGDAGYTSEPSELGDLEFVYKTYLFKIDNETQTTDGTLTTLLDTISVISNSVTEFHLKAVAIQSAGASGTVGDVMVKEFKGAIKNIAGTTVLVGTPTEIDTGAVDTGAADWEVFISANDSSDELEIDIQGEASKTIEWHIIVTTIVNSY